MYQSPISLIQKDVESKIDDTVIMTVQKVGVAVDRDELLCALRYDRNQYEKGYRDGLNDAVKHGKWIADKYTRKCSECESTYWMREGNAWNYCPNCGAKNGGEE